jgi:leucyl aminopeptidase
MKISTALSFLALALAVVAAPAPKQVPFDFTLETSPVDVDETRLKEEGLRLIELRPDFPPQWMTEQDVLFLMQSEIKFMDITDTPDLGLINANNANCMKPALPRSPIYQDEVKPFISDLNTDTMEFVLRKLTAFRTRYYKSESGAESARFLFKTISEIVANEEASEFVSVRKFKHPWNQFSIIARFEGSNKDFDEEVVIIGAHQDSVNLWLPAYGPAPGADDDGSGTVTILEAFRSLVENGFSPERPVEFHWYSAEEGGLLGSQAVAKDYESDGIRVVAMLQEDMTGYIGVNDEVIGIVTDYVDPQLTSFIKLLVSEYAAIPFKSTKCGYACSDHASWAKAGYRSAFTIEASFEDTNKNIHTTGDTIDKLSFDHMKEFAKVTVAFAVELGHPVDEDD